MTNNLCRYCPTADCYKELSQEYYWAGQKEKYTDIILETFNINILNTTGCKQLICDNCIKKLRDAAAFKSQVLNVEEMLESSLGTLEDQSKIEPILPLKEEPNDFEDNTSLGYHDDDDDMNDYKWQINDDDLKTENDGDVFVIKLLPKRENGKTKRESKSNKKTREKRSSIKKIIKKNKIKGKQKAEERPVKISQAHIHMKENSIKLILNSNMCLFESLKTKFRCFSCKESFRNITQLREHSQTHQESKLITNKVNRVRMSYKNTDISNLSCKICAESLNDLTDLRQHLIKSHDVKFSGDSHLLIPYKLESDFVCVICKEKFNTFMRLSVHMNSHSTNNVCEICGVSYINRISLRMHVSSLHRVKKCSICLALFKTNYARVKHMKNVHNTAHYKRYCLECDKTFQYTYMLVDHMIKDHGLKRDTANCTECGKTFQSPANLRVHMRAVHIKERNYPCGVCSMRFFTKCDQRRHERTHNDVRSYSCGYCEGKFKSKDSWRRHLKRQHGQFDE